MRFPFVTSAGDQFLRMLDIIGRMLVTRGKRHVTKVEFEIMDKFWSLGQASIREVQEAMVERSSRDYRTAQTIVYRLEGKEVLRRVGKSGNRHIFVPVISRKEALGQQVDYVLALLGGKSEVMVAHFIILGKLTIKDLQKAKEILIRLEGERSDLRKDV